MIGIRRLLTGCSGKLLEKKDNILIDDSLHLEYPRPYTGFPVCFSSEVATDLVFTDRTRFQFGFEFDFLPFPLIIFQSCQDSRREDGSCPSFC